MDRQDITLVSLWVHVPVIITWIGFVMLDFIASFTPGLSLLQRVKMITWSRWFVILAIPLIMITGIWQTIENPFYRVESYSGLEQLKERTLYGDLLFWKHGAVLATFGLTILVRFILAPRLGGSGQAELATDGGDVAVATGSLRGVQAASALNLVACLSAVLLATRMVVELH